MLAPVAASFRDDLPLHWIRVHRLPDFVYFHHDIHISKGIGCSTCHGRVDQMPLLWRTQSLDMSWCLDCHRAPEKYLRPRNRVFDMTWNPPPDQLQQGPPAVDRPTDRSPPLDRLLQLSSLEQQYAAYRYL